MLNKFAFQEVLSQAEKLKIPVDKKRNILREYFQCRFLEFFYSLKNSHKLIFIGGTSLRLLHNLDRFSEDLDFDNAGLTVGQIGKLVNETIKQLEKEGFVIESSFKNLKLAGSFKIKFLKVLSVAGITSNPKEKLMIRFDYTTPQKLPKTQVFILSRFGVIQRIPSYSLETLLSYKFKAIRGRKRIIIRDFYDIAWLLSRKIKPNLDILEVKSEKEFYQKLQSSFKRLKPRLSIYKKILLPFLINEDKIRFLDLLSKLLDAEIGE